MRNLFFKISFLLISVLLFTETANAQTDSPEKQNIFIDTLDNKVDISEFLRTKYGFAFIPKLITEPAVGYGLGAAMLFIHRDPTELNKNSFFPSITAAGGLYTQNKSWGIFAGHLGIWKNGRIRYKGGAGYISVNLNYYREPVLEGGIEKIAFNLTTWGILQEAIFKLFSSDFYFGLSYLFSQAKVKLNTDKDLPEISDDINNINIGGLGVILSYDSRDNMFTPNVGIFGSVKTVYYDKFLGSDRKFFRLFSHLILLHPVTKNLFGGIRLDFQTSDDATPFYIRPFINLRGIPAMRYQGKTTYLGEGELRWDFSRRWSVVGFGGYGEALPINDLFEKQTAYNFGAGFRYLIARLYGVRVGIDIARGPEDWAFYIQFGNSWFWY